LTPLTRIQKPIKESRGLSPRALCRLQIAAFAEIEVWLTQSKNCC